MEYLFILLYCVFCILLYKKYNEWAKLHIGLLLFFTVLLFGLRYRVGVDTIRYYYHFEEIKDLFHIGTDDYLNAYGPAFITLFSFSKTVINSFVFFQIIHAIIVNLCIFLFFINRTRNPFLSIFFYFLVVGIVFNTEILRESLAVAVFVLNYKNIENNKWMKYYLIGVLDVCLHYSAIITLFVPFFRRIKIGEKSFIIFLFIYACLVFAMITYINSVGIPVEKIAERYSSQTTYQEENYVSAGYYITVSLRSILLPILLIIINRKYNIQDNRTIEPMLILFSIVSSTGFLYPAIFNRLSNYFILFYIISISNCISVLFKRRKQIGLFMFITLFVFFLYYNVKKENLERFYPYSSIFYPKQYSAREDLYILGI